MPSSATRATCRDLRGPGLGKALALHTYDACLIMAGTNDLAEGERGLRPEDAVESLARLIRVSTCTCVARCTRSANIAATVAPAPLAAAGVPVVALAIPESPSAAAFGLLPLLRRINELLAAHVASLPAAPAVHFIDASTMCPVDVSRQRHATEGSR